MFESSTHSHDTNIGSNDRSISHHCRSISGDCLIRMLNRKSISGKNQSNNSNNSQMEFNSVCGVFPQECCSSFPRTIIKCLARRLISFEENLLLVISSDIVPPIKPWMYVSAIFVWEIQYYVFGGSFQDDRPTYRRQPVGCQNWTCNEYGGRRKSN